MRVGGRWRTEAGVVSRPASRRRLIFATRLLAALLLAGTGAPALAHTTESSFVLTLPTDLYIAGGVVVVAVSFLLIALVPAANARAIAKIGRPVAKPPAVLATAASLVSLFVAVALILAGHLGTQDPLANPLPLAVWTLWWIGLTALHALFGNLWAAINPWRGLSDLFLHSPTLRYPAWLGYWPAVAWFLGFAWFELIFTVPQNPEILANVVAAYLVLNFVGVLLFGRAAWLHHAECFSVFFRIVAWLSPLNGRPEDTAGKIVLAPPGLGLLHVRPLPLSGIAFVILALSSVSFDGLSKTFWWLSLIGVNPLDFPGRSAVAAANSGGLLAVFAVLLGGYLGSVWLGNRLTGGSERSSGAVGLYVISIVPIALGYHLAHYLTVFLVDVQYAAITFNDPLHQGWNLFGLAEAHVTTSFLTNFHSVRLIWHGQVACIVVAHVVAVAIAHLLALRRLQDRKHAILSQLPLTVLMVAYTQFGLWLLSTASAG